ncbi:MFS transporter, DHA1 family, tetracycline resistance protein [Roseivivax halotolerans]|jgi:DHA1 family tetracycline resistance protein-like MFS transporter|uniref:MFS transporter, DHA1 family, tetracycline resistance protein n=1 Tax=Roseivivax halotolerans TaxID=93684 RepID=A0A1I5Y7H4_9RHOB|nr:MULTISPECIES: MFS transporter [Roseivivax]QFT63934.1 Tetracycline resistance protein, class C [Roseivivax sp. THAF30]SFQ39877.1 MFS transporter, DHA1 family, tetracycline resistance protein [Roseivivax halotolerans]
MRAAKLFLVSTVVIDAMGIGLIMPVMPDLLREITGSDIGNAALWGGLLATAFALMQFLCAPALGALSDRFGRRPVLFGALGGMAVDYVVMGFAGTIWLLLLGRIVAGITAATQAVASAAMSDLSRPEEKAQNFGLIGAGFGIGFVIGPLLGGLLGEFGTRAPFFAAAALAALNLLIGYLALPETVTEERRRPVDVRRLDPLGAFRALRRIPGTSRALAVFFLLQMAFFVYPSIWSYYGVARFGWDPGLIGFSLGIFGITAAIMQGGLIRVFLRHLGERGTVIYGLTMNSLVFILLAFLQSGTLVLILVPLAGFAAVTSPAIQGLVARVVPDDEQGALQGLFSATGAMAAILSPPVMTTTFFWFTRGEDGFAGAPFLLSVGLLGIALALMLGPGGVGKPSRSLA